MSKLEALSGLLPLAFFYTEAVIVFTTEWGQRYPALAVLLLMPSYCLMTCRHIICSVTRMIFDWRQLNPLWFLLFIVNKVVIPMIRKSFWISISLFDSCLKISTSWRRPQEWLGAWELGCWDHIFRNIHSVYEVHSWDNPPDYYIPRHQLPYYQEEGGLNHWDGRLGNK